MSFKAVIVTPPCSTYSRAQFANDQGPYPVRSNVRPRGFPWNSAPRRQKATLGNMMADFSFEALRRQARHRHHVAFMEQPEDLGATKNSRIPGHRPASMWQFPQFEEALQEGLRTAVFSQLDYGSLANKPTRLLMKWEEELPDTMYEGKPQMDEAGYYMGPLPRRHGVPLIGRRGEGFATSAAAEWPSPLCEWVAESIIASYRKYSGRGCSNDEKNKTVEEQNNKRRQQQCDGGDEKRRKLDEREGEEEKDPSDPMDPLVKGGQGQPQHCEWKGMKSPFQDGGGLSSPGRWRRQRRIYPDSVVWRNFREELHGIACKKMGGEAELEKEFFRMTRGGQHFKLVKDEAFLEEVRECVRWHFGLKEEEMNVSEGQPFFLRILRRVLEEAKDCDTEFLKQAEVGFPLGALNGLPRTPAVFEKQVKWALDYDPSAVWELSKSNYISAEQHVDHLREHLEAEVKAGLMSKMKRRDFEEKYGENRAIAALAVLVEDEASGKKRVIHDGTHDIGVNNRIRCQDKVRMPGPREKRRILQEMAEERSIVMALVGGTSRRLTGGSSTCRRSEAS